MLQVPPDGVQPPLRSSKPSLHEETTPVSHCQLGISVESSSERLTDPSNAESKAIGVSALASLVKTSAVESVRERVDASVGGWVVAAEHRDQF